VGDNNSIRLELLPVRRRVKRRGGLGVRQAQASGRTILTNRCRS